MTTILLGTTLVAVCLALRYWHKIPTREEYHDRMATYHAIKREQARAAREAGERLAGAKVRLEA